jgi:hypothetical protein
VWNILGTAKAIKKSSENVKGDLELNGNTPCESGVK